jgi:uncharacterized protein YecE (DUF72 family)
VAVPARPKKIKMLADVPRDNLFVGVAGWNVSTRHAADIPQSGSHLERYAHCLNAVEINSSFNKSHRVGTYSRWAAGTPVGFQFSIKAPRTITHERRLVGCDPQLDAFAAQILGLGSKLALILVQLPPTLVFEQDIAESFVASLRTRFFVPVAVEPRHPKWFTTETNTWLLKHRIARVAADPPIAPGGADPGGCREVRYYRCHGWPKIYFSSYNHASLIALRARLREDAWSGARSWCIFDNTALGEAFGNALTLTKLLS